MSLPVIFGAVKTAFAGLGALGSTLQAGLAIGSTALNYAAGSAEARSQTAAIAAANEEARLQTISDYDQITLRGQQETAAAAQRITETAINRKRAVATATASASEGNVGGLSIGSLLSDIYGQEARIRDGVNQNLEATQDNLALDADTVARGYRNTLATRPRVNRPSLAGAFLDAGTGVYGAFKDDIRTRLRVNQAYA